MKKTIARICFRIAVFFRQMGRKFSPLDATRKKIITAWKQQEGEKKLRYEYDLPARPIVFDLGGFEGDWTSEIAARYEARVELFEPHPVFAKNIANRFKGNTNINVHAFGLGAKDEKLNLGTDAESTSTFKIQNNANIVEVDLKNAKDFIHKNNFQKIDLIKINIEGGEFELLEFLIEEGLITRFQELQIQFHHFVPNAISRMKTIQEGLARTHHLTYQFEFLWENWKIKK
ncbi:MAG: FkbM family methyltransferase [Saprospiraceae bacterium]